MTTTRELTRNQRVVLALIITYPGITARELTQNTHQTLASVSGTIVSLMGAGMVLRSYKPYPPCTYWATQKAQELYAEDTANGNEEDT